MEENLIHLYDTMNEEQRKTFIQSLMKEFEESEYFVMNWLNILEVSKKEMLENAIFIAQNIHNNQIL